MGKHILVVGGRGTETPVLLLDTQPSLYTWRSYYKIGNLVGRWPPCHVLHEITYFASKPLIHQAQFLQVLLKVVFINGIVLQRRAIVVYRLWRVRQDAHYLCTFSNITVIKLFILRSFQKKEVVQ